MKKKIFKALKPFAFFAILITSFIACDKDFTTLGTDIIGGNNFSTGNKSFPIVAYTKQLDGVLPVQTNGLPSNLLGVLQDDIFAGNTTANIITQLSPLSFDPNFGDNPMVESVLLTIPYFSTLESTDDEGNNTYALDSIWGSDPIKLSIYENTYFLRNLDPDSEDNVSQRYYSDANTTINFDNFRGATIYEYETLPGNGINEFIPSTSEHVITEMDTDTGELTVTERIAPQLRATLDNAFWQALIIDKEGEPELSNANNFLDYFRGLYIKVEALTGNGNMLMLNMAQASITITYSFDTTTDGVTTSSEASYVLNSAGVRLNTLENNFTNMPTGNATTGDEQLFIKGGQGYMSIFNLFDGQVVSCEDGTMVDALAYIKSKKDTWLINEANIIVYEDESVITDVEGDAHKYDRLYAYDIKNDIPLIDYFLDPTSNTITPLNSNIFHLGQRTVTTENSSTFASYKIRVTEHIKNIIQNDSTNYKIGIALSSNVNNSEIASVLDTDPNAILTGVSTGMVLSPRSTVFHGSHQNVPDNKRIKLEIYYTDVNNSICAE